MGTSAKHLIYLMNYIGNHAISNIKTKAKVIVLALQALIKKNEVAKLKVHKGKVNLNIDIDSLRKRNASLD